MDIQKEDKKGREHKTGSMEISMIREGRMGEREESEWMKSISKSQNEGINNLHTMNMMKKGKIVLDRDNTHTADGALFSKVRHARLLRHLFILLFTQRKFFWSSEDPCF